MKSIRVEKRGENDWGAAAALAPHFAPMIARLEIFAVGNPRAHAFRVLAAGVFGYAVLAATLLISLAIFGGIVVILIAHPGVAAAGIKLLIPIGGVALSLILALRVDWPEPNGIAVTRQQAPALHQLVDSVRAATAGPHVHDIRITDAMNAAITQYPRLLFLSARNTLFVGLPLLQALAPDEIEAVIAHEMGHFAGHHGRSASFIYHIRVRWSQLGERLPGGIVAGALRRFFAWYGPWFAAYSFVLARQQEYEADARAAAIVGSQTMADALVRTACQNASWHRGWSLIWEEASERSDPPASPYRTLGALLSGEPDPAASDMLERALACQPDLDDTHPSLSQRLAALGVAPQLPPPILFPAADRLLGSALPEIIDRVDAGWHGVADDIWVDQYQERQTMRAERADLDARAEMADLDEDALHRLAQLIEAIDGPRDGANAFAALIARYPEAHGARFRHGDALLDADDETGITSLLAAADGEPSLRLPALDRIVRYAYATGRSDLIETFEPRRDAAAVAEAALHQAFSTIDEAVVLRPLDPDQRDELAALTATIAGVKWLRAGLRDFPSGTQLVFMFAAHRRHEAVEVLDTLVDAMLPTGIVLGMQDCRSRRWLTRRLGQLPCNEIRGQAGWRSSQYWRCLVGGGRSGANDAAR